MSVDWKRYGLRGPRAALILGRMVPKPDLICCRQCSPEEARRRKPELEMSTGASSITNGDSTHSLARRIVVDNMRPIEELIEELIPLAWGGPA